MLDPPTAVTPLVQCGGRARAPGARYLLLAQDDKQQADLAKLIRCQSGALVQ